MSASAGTTEVAREEEDVVEGESFVDGTVDHGSLENWDLIMGLRSRAQTESLCYWWPVSRPASTLGIVAWIEIEEHRQECLCHDIGVR